MQMKLMTAQVTAIKVVLLGALLLLATACSDSSWGDLLYDNQPAYELVCTKTKVYSEELGTKLTRSSPCYSYQSESECNSARQALTRDGYQCGTCKHEQYSSC